MKLLTVGDSFTYGEELDDISNAWPYVLGQMIGYEVTNLGQPASSNDKIVRKVLENYQDYDLMVIAWSHYARIEMADEYGIYDIWPGSNESVHSGVDHRKDIVRYISRHHDEIHDMKKYLTQVVLLQNFLKNNSKKYVMVNAFGNNYLELSEKQDLTSLASLIDQETFLGWPDKQFVVWTYGCPQGPNGHFLDEGHQRVADKINEHIRNLGWLS